MVLRDYQIETSTRASECLRSHGLVYLAMETRTGKTITAFETIKKYGARSVLFVTKLKAKPSVEADHADYADFFRLEVINYESVAKCRGYYDLIVIDEAHSLGAFPKPSKRVKDLLYYTMGRPIIYLSATPTPESYSQIYHQLAICSHSPFRQHRSFYSWANVYVDKRRRKVNGHELNDYTHAKIEAIEPMIKHLFFTQTQGDSGFEQTIQEQFIYVDLEPVQTGMIKRLIEDRIVTGKITGAVVLADTAVKLQSKIHQICSGTVKDEGGEGHILSYSKAMAIKVRFMGKKIAIYYKFKAEFEALKTVFPDFTEIPEVFQQSSSGVFLGQFLSAREGIRLDTADAIVFYNIDFSYLSYAQAKNRIVSKERTADAVLYWVFTNGGIEQKIHRVVSKKKDYTSYYFKKDYL